MSASASTPFEDTHVTCAAFHPQRQTAIIATRRPNAYLCELNLSTTPASPVGMPIFTAFTPTQLFITTTGSGADRVIVILENRTVEVYSWLSGRGLLYRHTPKSRTLKEYAIRIAMADVYGSVLFMVPLLRVGDRGRGTAKEPLPEDTAYHSFMDPELAYALPDGTRQMATVPASRFYYFDCFKANNKEKHVPYIDTDVPIVGLRAHTGGAPMIAVLGKDGGLRLYDLDDPSTEAEQDSVKKPVLYNVAPLSKSCPGLQMPTFSKVALNGDGRTKVFDFVPGATRPQVVTYGKRSHKSKRVYTNIAVAVVEEKRLSVLDLTTPGTCDIAYSVAAPPKVDFVGVSCDPVGAFRNSGVFSTSELSVRGGPDALSFSRGQGSRRLIWAGTTEGRLQPFTMDDGLCATTKLLVPADWVRPVDLLPASTGADRRADPVNALAPEKPPVGASPSRTRHRAASPHAEAAPHRLRASRSNALTEGDCALLAHWVGKPSANLTADLVAIMEPAVGRLLRLQISLHPTLPLVLGIVPLDGSLFVRRLPSVFHDQHHLCTIGSVATSSTVPGAALSPHTLLSRRAGCSPLCAAPEYAFVADARSGVSTMRVVAVDRRVSSHANSAVNANQPTSEVVSGSGLDDAQMANTDGGGEGGGAAGTSDAAGATAAPPTESHLIAVIEEKGQVAVSRIESIPLRHLGAHPGCNDSTAIVPSPRFWLVAIEYSVSTPKRSLANRAVSQVNTLMMVIDAAAVEHAPSETSTALSTRQTVLGASPALKWLRVIEQRSVSRIAGHLHAPVVALTSRRSDLTPMERCWVLDLSRLRVAVVEGHEPLPDDLGCLRVGDPGSVLTGLPRSFADHSCTAIVFADDVAAAVREESPVRGAERLPIAIGYAGGSRSVVVFGRSTGIAVVAVPLSVTPGDDGALKPATCLQLAATVFDDDSGAVALFTSDGRLTLVLFEAEQRREAKCTSPLLHPDIERRGVIAWTTWLPMDAAPTSLLFVGPLLVVQAAAGNVTMYTAAEGYGHRLQTLPFGSVLLTAAPDRLVAMRPSPRAVVTGPGNVRALDPPLAATAHCPVAMLGSLLVAVCDMAAARCNASVVTGADVEHVGQTAATTVRALAHHLCAQAPHVSLGPITTLARYGFHLLAGDVLKSQAAAMVGDAPLAMQPASVRLNDRLLLSQTIRTRLPSVGYMAAGAAPSAWPVSVVDTCLMHTERARQFAAAAHHKQNAGAVVVVDQQAVSAVKRGAGPVAVSSSVPGMSQAHQALQQVAWTAGNERGQYAFDTLVALACHVPWDVLTPEVARAISTVTFADDAATWRAYCTATALYGTATHFIAQLLRNFKAATNGRRLPRILVAHDQLATADAERAKALGVAGDAPSAVRLHHRETLVKAINASAAEVHLGSAFSGKLPTYEFPVSSSLANDPSAGEVLNSYDGEVVLLAQSALALWPGVRGGVAGGDTAADYGRDGGSGNGASGAASSTGQSNTDQRSSRAGSARTGLSYGGGGSSRYAPSGYATAAYAAPPAVSASQSAVMSAPAPAPLAAAPVVAAAAVTASAYAVDTVGDIAGGQPDAPSSAAPSLAEQQQRAMQNDFFDSRPRPGADDGFDSSDDSSNDGTGPRRVDIKLRAPAEQPTAASTSAAGAASSRALFFGSEEAAGAGSTAAPTGVNRRRLGGTSQPSAGSDQASARAVPVEDLLASGFGAVEEGRWSVAEEHFGRVVERLRDDAAELAQPQRLILVANYRALCSVQTLLGSGSLDTAPPVDALATGAQMAHLRVAGEHLGRCLRELLEMAVVLQWPAAVTQLLSLMKFSSPELFDAPEGIDLEARAAAVPGFGTSDAATDEDTRVVASLRQRSLCFGSLKLQPDTGTAAEPPGPTLLIPCTVCELDFSLGFVEEKMAKDPGDSAESRITACPLCGAGVLAMPSNYVPSRTKPEDQPAPGPLGALGAGLAMAGLVVAGTVATAANAAESSGRAMGRAMEAHAGAAQGAASHNADSVRAAASRAAAEGTAQADLFAANASAAAATAPDLWSQASAHATTSPQQAAHQAAEDGKQAASDAWAAAPVEAHAAAQSAQATATGLAAEAAEAGHHARASAAEQMQQVEANPHMQSAAAAAGAATSQASKIGATVAAGAKGAAAAGQTAASAQAAQVNPNAHMDSLFGAASAAVSNPSRDTVAAAASSVADAARPLGEAAIGVAQATVAGGAAAAASADPAMDDLFGAPVAAVSPTASRPSQGPVGAAQPQQQPSDMDFFFS